MKPTTLLELRKGMRETQEGVKQIERYMKNVEKTGSGFDSLTNLWSAKANVIFGKPLGEVDFAALEQKGQLQGLLGKFRKEVVGGGVMTEFDAQRVLMALGGEPNVARHPEIARRLLRSMVEAKVGTYNDVSLPMFNDQARRGKVYGKLEALEIPSIFSDQQGGDAALLDKYAPAGN